MVEVITFGHKITKYHSHIGMQCEKKGKYIQIDDIVTT